MLKSIAKFLTPAQESQPTLSFETHRADVEFALVFVEGGSDQQTIWTLGSVSEDAAVFQGVVLQIMGPVVFIAFTGVSGASAPSKRKEFSAHIAEKHRILVRLIHGERSAVVGTMGGANRLSYTAIPDQMSDLLGQLANLAPGQVLEV